LTSAKNFADKIVEHPETTTREEIESRIKILDEAYVKFQAISEQLSNLSVEEESELRDVEEETEFDERYTTIKAALTQCLEKFKSSTPAAAEGQISNAVLAQLLEQQLKMMQQLSDRSTDVGGNDAILRVVEQQNRMMERWSPQSSTPREPQVKLPIIKLPTFNGNMEEWKRYADTFKTLIHDSDLSNVQKYQYLVGSLSGPAAKVIESIEISEQNYTIAWELLKGRYEDERAIRKRHIQCLFELPRVHRESVNAIRELIDHVQRHIRVLKSMKLPTEHWGEIIVHFVEKSLDYATRRRWEEHAETLDELTTDAIINFLQRRSQILERASFNESSGKFNHNDKADGKSKQPFYSKSQNKTVFATSVQGGRCYMCQGQHLIYSCGQFLGLSVKDRIQTVARLKLCINCLKNDHFVANCKSGSCRECGERHNTLCHRTRETTSSMRNAGGEPNGAGTSGNSTPSMDSGRKANSSAGASSGPLVHHVRGEAKRKRVLMSTAIVNAKGSENCIHQLRILLDSASEANFITLAACKKLGVKLQNAYESVHGLGDVNCTTINQGCQVQLLSRNSTFTLNPYCLVVSKITKELPSFSIAVSQLSIPENLKLADPLFSNPSNVDVLIGGEFFFNLLENGRIELGDDSPVLQNSKLGWILSGSIPEHLVIHESISQLSVNAYTCLLMQKENINDTMQRFWELEEYPVENRVTMSKEERECESYFVNTVTRDSFGRFVVRLPFKKNRAELGESRRLAMKRLNYLERKFKIYPEFFDKYSMFMREYIELNHMSKVENETETIEPIYLPHHGVWRESSTTTKLRVVFDGSAKTASGHSLNDTLMTGANLQDNIIDIIMRFRLHSIAITADLKKMYRQVLIDERDRDYQRIVWRFSATEPVEVFRLNTVTYGLACAPFLAIRCVKYLASNADNKFSEASRVLLNDLYVDDILTGVDCKGDAITLINQLKALLSSGGFEPHKWRSNCREILTNENAAEQNDECAAVAINANNAENNSNTKTLGLNWYPEKDVFKFSIQIAKTSNATKREVLSSIAKLFDPLGLISPNLMRAKLIMQGTWAANLSWDDSLTGNLQQAWNEYVDELRNVNTIMIPRRVISGIAKRFYLHAFCDASMKAYGACVYLVTTDEENKTSSALLCSKSRIAPIKNKTITLPRLELCGAVVLVRLVKNTIEALKLKYEKIYAWSDSTIALAWIAGDPSRQKIFVSNRTAEIQSTLPTKYWHHVRSEDNPADLISRGASLENLQDCKIWWEGPKWLLQFNERSLSEFKLTNLSQRDINILESEQKLETRVFSNVKKNHMILELLNYYSSLTKIIRILSWIRRFLLNCKSTRDKRNYDHVSIDEIKGSEQIIIKEVQNFHFADELADFKLGRQIKSTSKLSSFSPFLDKYGILRVGGRIQNSFAVSDKKHPILLPHDSRFTRLLFEQEHRKSLHAGPQATLYAIRERYWPIRGKQTARKVVHECVTCFRNKPKSSLQSMGQLPEDRVTPKRPFSVTGVDFAGPIITLVNRGRGRKTTKSYIALFICFVTKAVHIEAVSDLTAISFIATLRRFVGRRGCPQRIVCDNATNFVGASKEIDEMRQIIVENANKINDEFCIPNRIEWKFIPPAAPHMGGLWEAGIKSCKFHLKRVIGLSLLTFEELATVLIQIEACLNSRPICQLPSTVTDLQPLTPGHFLIGDLLTSAPEIDLSDEPINRLDRWQLVQKIARDFWRRWNREYLTSLQEKTKWKVEKYNLTIGDVVIIHDDNLPPLKWRLGKVIETHPGKDEIVRVVTVKTANGIIKRAIHKLCKLPTTDLL